MKALVGCAGFGGIEIALRQFGIEALGIEIEDTIAEVNRFNGGNCLTADILSLNPADFTGYGLFHVSPPCPNFSTANQSGSESGNDLSLARHIAHFIEVIKPEYFTLENVWLYRKSESWAIILTALQKMGYGMNWWHLNAADYGVPQSRKRMIVIARRDGRQPVKPWSTHSKTGDMFTKPWRGWYEAVEDLIPELPDSQFATWQMDRMPDDLKTFVMDSANAGNGKVTVRIADNPYFTVTTEQKTSPSRTFIWGQGNYSRLKDQNQPEDTITGNNNQTGVKSFIINSQNTSRALTVRLAHDPTMTVNANSFEKNSPPKAFVVDCQNNGSPDKPRGLTIRQEDDPIFTMTASANRPTIRTGLGSGRVVSMTPRALARFQDFPDSFILPGEAGLVDNQVIQSGGRSDRELACIGIGNAVPPGLYRAVLRSLALYNPK